MVGNQPEALRRLQSQRQVEARRDRPRTDAPRLWSATATVPNAGNDSTGYPGSAEEASGGTAVLRGACALTAPAVCRLDRIRQARGDEGQTPERGDPPPRCRQAAGTQIG